MNNGTNLRIAYLDEDYFRAALLESLAQKKNLDLRSYRKPADWDAMLSWAPTLIILHGQTPLAQSPALMAYLAGGQCQLWSVDEKPAGLQVARHFQKPWRPEELLELLLQESQRLATLDQGVGHG